MAISFHQPLRRLASFRSDRSQTESIRAPRKTAIRLARKLQMRSGGAIGIPAPIEAVTCDARRHLYQAQSSLPVSPPKV
jgi:hypothetical protein